MLTEKELSSRWQISRSTLSYWRQVRKGPKWVRLGSHIRYRLADVEQFERDGELKVAA